jgi:hypothetical protein
MASSPEDDNLTPPQATRNVTVEYAFDMQVESPGEPVGYDHASSRSISSWARWVPTRLRTSLHASHCG